MPQQHHQDRPCPVVLLQAPNCPVHNQSSIITNSTRTRAGVLIECLDDVALPLIRETLLKSPPEFMLSPPGVHCMLCMLCMLHSMLPAALAAATGYLQACRRCCSSIGQTLCCCHKAGAVCSSNRPLEVPVAADASHLHTVTHHKLLAAGVRPMGPAFGGRFGPEPRAGDRRPLGRGNPREDRSVLFIREVGAPAPLGGAPHEWCTGFSLLKELRCLTHLDADQTSRPGDSGSQLLLWNL